MNILVIDDSRCQRKLIVAMIEDIGFKALCANIDDFIKEKYWLNSNGHRNV